MKTAEGRFVRLGSNEARALRKFHQVRRLEDAGDSIGAAASPRMTLRAVAERWFEAQQADGVRDVDRDFGRFKNHVDPLIGSRRIGDIEALLPAESRYVEIPGGNHAQFGFYGEQEGDGEALIERVAQQQMIVAATLQLIRSVVDGAVPEHPGFAAAAALGSSWCSEAQRIVANVSRAVLPEGSIDNDAIQDPRAFGESKASVDASATPPLAITSQASAKQLLLWLGQRHLGHTGGKRLTPAHPMQHFAVERMKERREDGRHHHRHDEGPHDPEQHRRDADRKREKERDARLRQR